MRALFRLKRPPLMKKQKHEEKVFLLEVQTDETAKAKSDTEFIT